MSTTKQFVTVSYRIVCDVCGRAEQLGNLRTVDRGGLSKAEVAAWKARIASEGWRTGAPAPTEDDPLRLIDLCPEHAEEAGTTKTPRTPGT